MRFASKGQRLAEAYGITLYEYNAILAAQGNVCAICRGKRSTYDVDHAHDVEAELVAQGIEKPLATRLSVRGICCRRCNRRLLPASTDSVEVLQNAIEYLIDPPAQRVLTEFGQ